MCLHGRRAFVVSCTTSTGGITAQHGVSHSSTTAITAGRVEDGWRTATLQSSFLSKQVFSN